MLLQVQIVYLGRYTARQLAIAASHPTLPAGVLEKMIPG
jgi:hypothetical protein